VRDTPNLGDISSAVCVSGHLLRATIELEISPCGGARANLLGDGRTDGRRFILCFARLFVCSFEPNRLTNVLRRPRRLILREISNLRTAATPGALINNKAVELMKSLRSCHRQLFKLGRRLDFKQQKSTWVKLRGSNIVASSVI
jgi:hypothetical protein